MRKRTTGNPTGRPPGKDYPIARTMLLAESDLATLQRIAATRNAAVTETVRQLIREEGRRLDRAERRHPVEA